MREAGHSVQLVPIAGTRTRELIATVRQEAAEEGKRKRAPVPSRFRSVDSARGSAPQVGSVEASRDLGKERS